MRGSYYAQALHGALRSKDHDEEKLLEHFVKTVIENGHAHLFPKITKSFERIVAKDVKQGTIEVTSATALTDEAVSQLFKKEPFKHALQTSHKRVVRKTDPGIVGGIVVRTGTTRIDASYKRALSDLYQTLIST